MAGEDDRAEVPDYERHVRDAFPELDAITDEGLRDRVVEAWALGLRRGGWRDIHDVGYPIAVQRAIPHFLGEVPDRTLEAELVKSATTHPRTRSRGRRCGSPSTSGSSGTHRYGLTPIPANAPSRAGLPLGWPAVPKITH